MAIYAQIGIDEALALQKQSDADAYTAFVDKFKPKKTTDDCYTPAPVFDAVAAWAAQEYGFSLGDIVRPFWPGGDYEAFDYPPGCVVVDNPPFSIIGEIIGFYTRRGIRFFLFAPSLTLCTAMRRYDVTGIVGDCNIVYENKAEVKTGFLTNLDDRYRIRTEPTLYAAVKEAVDAIRREQSRELPKYDYPYAVVSSANLQRIARYVELRIPKGEARFCAALDAQKAAGKAIFGGGLLLSERAAAERAAAERAAAERAAAERAAAERAAATAWKLSEREKRIQEEMKGGNPHD